VAEYGHFVPLKRDSNYACPEGAFGIAPSHRAAHSDFVGYLITSGNEPAAIRIDRPPNIIRSRSTGSARESLTDDFFASRHQERDRIDLHIASSCTWAAREEQVYPPMNPFTQQWRVNYLTKEEQQNSSSLSLSFSLDPSMWFHANDSRVSRIVPFFFRLLPERVYSITIADIATDGRPILGPACYYRRPSSLYDPESRTGRSQFYRTVNLCVNPWTRGYNKTTRKRSSWEPSLT